MIFSKCSHILSGSNKKRNLFFFLMPLSENHTEGQGWGCIHDCLYWESVKGCVVPFTFVCLCFMCDEVTKLSWHSRLWEIWIQTSHQGPGFQLLEGWLHVLDVVKEICFYTVCRKLMRWPIFIQEYFWALRGPHVFWQRDTAIFHPCFLYTHDFLKVMLTSRTQTGIRPIVFRLIDWWNDLYIYYITSLDVRSCMIICCLN